MFETLLLSLFHSFLRPDPCPTPARAILWVSFRWIHQSSHRKRPLRCARGIGMGTVHLW